MISIIISGVLFFLLGGICVYGIFVMAQKKELPADFLIKKTFGFLISRGLYVVADLSLADQLLDGPKTADYIAQNCALSSDAVFRLLRMLASHGIFEFNDDSTFSLNEVSQLLTTVHPQSLREFLLHEDAARWQAYGALEYTIKTGQPAFNYLFKEGYFDYIAHDKKRSEQFDKGMANLSEEENRVLASFRDFSHYGHIVDVGGGVGGLVGEIIKKHPDVHATVFELPHITELAKKYVDEYHLSGKVTVAAGSFLETVVPGGDVYILKRILHDWDDLSCSTILDNCYKAMGAHSQLIIFDCVVPEGNSYDMSKDIDIIMMTIFGGKERTQIMFDSLLKKSGFKLLSVKPIPGTMLSEIYAIKQ